MDLSSSNDDALLEESNNNNLQNMQQSDILVGDPLLLNEWDCNLSAAADDNNSNGLVLDADGKIHINNNNRKFRLTI
jgi:hypothetical protein